MTVTWAYNPMFGIFFKNGCWGATEQLWNAFHNCSVAPQLKPPSSEPRESRKSLRKSSQISRSSVNRPEIGSVTRARQLWRTGLLPARRSTASPQTMTRWRWGRCRRSRLPENSGEVLLGQPLSTCLHQLSPLVHFRDPPRRRSPFVYISRRSVGSGGFT